MMLSIWLPTFGNSIRMGGATSRMGGATSFPYPALPSRFKNLLNAAGVYHPIQTLNAEFDIAGESYTGLCLAILQ